MIRDFLLIAVTAFGLAIAATAADGWPGPSVHDEFSLIRGAETLAAGRAAYPSPREADAFATFHTLTRPTYATKYLPAHPLVLALGIRAAGTPRLGQWLAFSALAAATFYLLLPFGRTRARVITLLSTIALADTVWASGYLGGAVPAAGAALLLGAALRLRAQPTTAAGLLAGAGAAVLVASRPWEGFWFGLPIGFVLVGVFVGGGSRARVAVGLSGLLLSATLVALARYNSAVTGVWHLPAYVLYERSAGGAPALVWQDTTPARAARASESLRDQEDLRRYRELRTHPVRTLGSRVRTSGAFFGEPALAIAALLAVLGIGSAPLMALASLLGGIGATSVSSFFTPNYLSAALAPLLVLVACGAQRIAERRAGVFLLGALGLTVLISSVNRLVVRAPAERERLSPASWHVRRNEIVEQLLRHTPASRHTVFVRYGPSYDKRHEWVQNSANLSRAPILWVHDRGDSSNAVLAAAWPGRRTWLLQLDYEGGGLVTRLVPTR